MLYFVVQGMRTNEHLDSASIVDRKEITLSWTDARFSTGSIELVWLLKVINNTTDFCESFGCNFLKIRGKEV